MGDFLLVPQYTTTLLKLDMSDEPQLLV